MTVVWQTWWPHLLLSQLRDCLPRIWHKEQNLVLLNVIDINRPFNTSNLKNKTIWMISVHCSWHSYITLWFQVTFIWLQFWFSGVLNVGLWWSIIHLTPSPSAVEKEAWRLVSLQVTEAASPQPLILEAQTGFPGLHATWPQNSKTATSRPMERVRTVCPATPSPMES